MNNFKRRSSNQLKPDSFKFRNLLDENIENLKPNNLLKQIESLQIINDIIEKINPEQVTCINFLEKRLDQLKLNDFIESKNEKLAGTSCQILISLAKIFKNKIDFFYLKQFSSLETLFDINYVNLKKLAASVCENLVQYSDLIEIVSLIIHGINKTLEHAEPLGQLLNAVDHFLRKTNLDEANILEKSTCVKYIQNLEKCLMHCLSKVKDTNIKQRIVDVGQKIQNNRKDSSLIQSFHTQKSTNGFLNKTLTKFSPNLEVDDSELSLVIKRSSGEHLGNRFSILNDVMPSCSYLNQQSKHHSTPLNIHNEQQLDIEKLNRTFNEKKKNKIKDLEEKMGNFEAWLVKRFEKVNQRRRQCGISDLDLGRYFQEHMLFKKSFNQKLALLERRDFMINTVLFENKKKIYSFGI